MNITIHYLLRPLSASLAVPLLLLGAPASALAEYETWTNDDGTVGITAYTGPGGDVIVPGTINGLPVTDIGGFDNNGLTSVTIPDSVRVIAFMAFSACSGST
jgi:hypothetical protein